MQPNFFVGQLIGWAILLAIGAFVRHRSDLDDKAKANFAQVLVLNFLISFVSLIFYSQNQGDNILWFGSAVPTPHDYSKLAVFGVGSRDWFRIALAKFVLSNVVACILAVPVYLLNLWLLRHYQIGRSTVWAAWLTAGVVFVFLLSSAIGGYQFVAERR
jgi:hypothetical protein